MDNLITVVQSVEASIVQIENITLELKVMSETIPTVTKQVEEFTKSMTRLKNNSTETFITMEDKFGNLITMSQKTRSSEVEEMNSSLNRTFEEISAPAKAATPPPLPPPPPPVVEPPPAAEPKEDENKMKIGEAIKGMPEELENLRTQYENVVKSAEKFGNIVKDGADKVFIQSGAAQFLMEKIPLLGDIYNELEAPLQNVMQTVGDVSGVMGEFANSFHDGVDFAAKLAGGIKDAYSAAEGGLQSFNNYINTVKEIDTMVRTLTDAQKWAAFFTNIYTAAQSALNVVMNLSPWTIVIGLILALIAAFKIAWDKSENFRRVLFGIWEAAKVVFSGLFDIGKTLFDAYIIMWKGIAEVILGALNAPFDGGEMYRKGMDDIAKSTDMLTGIPDKMKKLGEDVGKAWEQGKEKGSQSYQKSLEEKRLLELQKKPKVEAPAQETNLVSTKSITGANKHTGGSSAGTNNSRNISVRIESLVKEINIFSNVKEGAQDVRRLIQEELIAAVRDFEGAMA